MTEYIDRLAERVAIVMDGNNAPEPPPKDLLDYAEKETQRQYSRTGIYKEPTKRKESA